MALLFACVKIRLSLDKAVVTVAGVAIPQGPYENDFPTYHKGNTNYDTLKLNNLWVEFGLVKYI